MPGNTRHSIPYQQCSWKMRRHFCFSHLSPSKPLVPRRGLPGQIQEGASHAFNQEGWPGPRDPCQLQTNIKPRNHLQSAWTIISVAAQRSHLAMFKVHSISIGLQTVPQHWDCHAQNIERCLHHGRRSTLYMPCGAWPFCSIRHLRPRLHYRSPPSHLWHRIIGHRLAHVLPYKQIAIREVWRRPFTTYTL